MNRFLSLTLAGLVAATLVPRPADAATFVGTATLRTADDLTIVADGGLRFAFVDLTSTTSLSAAGAVAEFAADGFGLATLGQVNVLFDAFGIDPFPAPTGSGLTTVPVSPEATADVAGLIDAIGATAFGTAGIGRVATGGSVSEICISTAANCAGTTGWVFGTERSASSALGTFLVREEALAPIPLPATGLLLVGALGGLVAARRRAARA